MRYLISIFIIFNILFLISPVNIYAQNASAPTVASMPDRFVVPLSSTLDQIEQSLLDQNYIKNKDDFNAIFIKKKGDMAPGAYKITLGMTIQKISSVLHAKPYMKWVVIPPGLRKEEIADLLASTLGWTKTQKNKMLNLYNTKNKPEYIEGVYFPDTYLIPVAETPQNVANRLIAKFNENFAQYLPQFTNQNMKWTVGLTLASLVQREAVNEEDMPLIAGILLNRLNQKMPLDIDATIQYIRGNKGKGYWAPVTVADKKIVSPYNTYKNAGLPPHPIANPGLAAIQAVLKSAKTDCLYYLHDKTFVTHCAVTYEEHLANIQKYLK